MKVNVAFLGTPNNFWEFESSFVPRKGDRLELKLDNNAENFYEFTVDRVVIDLLEQEATVIVKI